MHPHGAFVLLGWMAQVPRLLGDLDIAVPDQATLIVVIKGLQGLFDWSVCLPDGFAPGPRVLPIPRVRDHRMERIGLQGPTVVLAPKLGRPLLVIDGLPRHAHALRLQPLSLGDSALPMRARTHPAAKGHPLARRRLHPGIDGHRHGRCGGHHTAAPVVVAPRPIDAIQNTLSNDDHG